MKRAIVWQLKLSVRFAITLNIHDCTSFTVERDFQIKIVITGATGFVGQLLVIDLRAAGHSLLLVGRDVRKLAQLFPDVPSCDYSQLAELGANYNMLVHLAVANNDAAFTEQNFFSVNLDFLLEVGRLSKRARIKRFINVSSVHALDLSNKSAYARSKRAGAAALTAEEGLVSQTIYLPLVYGARWAGKLKYMNALPRPLAVHTFDILAALKPTVHIEKLTTNILENATNLSGEPVLLYDNQDLNAVYTYSKRLFDITFAVAIISLIGWFLLLVWMAIRLESPGPGIFAQSRVGKGGEVFTCYKFRTMKHGTEQAGTHEISAAVVTKLGSFIRKVKIDELPQVWNILRNEVSLIGPRPCLPLQLELIEARRARGVFSVKPGISGLAQINRIDMSDPIKLANWDARYIALRSFLLDLKITFATLTGHGKGDQIKNQT
jgi:lipopolysaccharide/colanic/teichoic acid biosynthesis glycosyltransferase